mmetsp:Transcript_29901/g.56072  ORF Transcript_29901/g.56072 Transcript_29901/m.56072 type:complete len:340 (-) Transcript_29901:549-1568(-)
MHLRCVYSWPRPSHSLQRLDSLLNFLLAVVVLVLQLLWDLLQKLLREDSQQRPGDVKRREDVAVLVWALGQKLKLKLVSELEILVLILAQGLFAHHCLHCPCVLADGVVGIQLIGHIWMIIPRHALSDARLHQSAEGRQHVDGWIDLPVVQGSVHKDLSLGDVASQVRDWVCDVIIGHGQDGELRDGTVSALDSACPLVDRGQIRVHVTRISSSSWHLFSSGRHLSQGICVGAHVGEDHENVLLARVREVLGRGQSQTRRDDAFDGRVICQVHEENNVLHGTVLLEVVPEETCRLHVHAHGTKDDAKVLLGVIQNVLSLHQRCLSAHLCGDLIVGQACC